MPSDVLIRLLWAAAIITAGLVGYRLVSFLAVSRVQGKSQRLELIQPGKPAILYFTTPDCAPCKTIQRPALSRVQSRLGDRLQVVEVNAYERPELAKEWGVLSVPTTFIIDASGRPRHVNHGVTPADKLIEQLAKFS
jgi:thiol-disulfide isomerase/thioredoxin